MRSIGIQIASSNSLTHWFAWLLLPSKPGMNKCLTFISIMKTASLFYSLDFLHGLFHHRPEQIISRSKKTNKILKHTRDFVIWHDPNTDDRFLVLFNNSTTRNWIFRY